MEIGIIGLGKMGMQIARRLHVKGHRVVAWNRSPEPRAAFERFGGKTASTVEDLVAALPRRKVIWVMLPSGETTEEMLKRLRGLLSAGDIVIDGGNSFFEDTVRRGKKFQARKIHFFDSGTSGGVWGEKNGFALMVGGDKKIWPQVRPVFCDLAAGKSFGLVGPSGSGHFVKMVHNGIEYGMMEAIAEGYGLIDRWDKNIDLAQVTKIWQNGSVIRSWLIDLCRDIFEKEDLSSVVGFVKATGEGGWTVKTGRKLGADVRVIAESLRVRVESVDRKNQKLLRNKLLALMRNRFGGHAVTRK
ncbi:MAG: decarboxylating 6-phosphogluconate dehydrogenase [Patescibacteria group bacterium]|nr:decarboxylating 6-phosphogluconate dehydrogenase [Patescibacteria group bacterium]